MHHRWCGVQWAEDRWRVDFKVETETKGYDADAVILALGGGSWPETGSDGAWISTLERLGVTITPLQPANCGWELAWPPELIAAAEGQPLKNIVARAGETEARGELLITRYGLEGGIIYQLGPALRAQAAPELIIDLKPANTIEQLIAKFGPIRRNFVAEAKQRWRLPDAAHALLQFCAGNTVVDSAEAIAQLAKHCALSLTGPRPIEEAISSAGGVRWSELDDHLMLQRSPGIFLAGEMIDWEAPTGGYLLQGCFATGTRAARGALTYSTLRR
jgi:uncharacterized flavoprotein (TIGR03862 family)